ncbi:MAG: hypothetical protein QM769_14550 [Pseudoxanthomonas sp.]
MKKILITAIAVLLISSYATTSAATRKQKIRSISYAEAAQFENSLLARGSEPIKPLEKLFTQPVNKTEACKLPTTQYQLDRKNFRAYWDGDCKNGYAFGLGRSIAISETHHLEEITTHSDSDDDYANRPFVTYDFVNNKTTYGVHGKKFPANIYLGQKITSPDGSIIMQTNLVKFDESLEGAILETSPLTPRRNYIYTSGNAIYKFSDFSEAPAASNQALKAIEIVDAENNIAGGVRIVQFRNGVVEHQKLGPGGQTVELVAIPQDYVNHLIEKIGKAQETIAAANITVQKAQQMEREYLYMACNGKHTIKGLDSATATKICTWRDQFKEPYEKALANYQQQMEQQRQQAAVQEQQLAQQRMYQQQQDQQQAIAKQQAWQSINNALQDTANQINQRTQQLNQYNQQLQQYNNEQMQNWGPAPKNRTTCVKTGSVTTCY